MRRWLQQYFAMCAFMCAVANTCAAQNRPQAKPPIKLARVEGHVISDLDERPLRRAHVMLRAAEAGITSVGAEADEKGNFDLRDVAPGRYSLIAERDGFLASAVCMKGALRMPPVISIGAGQSLSNLTFRLRPWAVITGKIRFEDGDPGINIRVDAYREYHFKSRHGYSIMMSARTDDRGEYRLHGLQPGSYFVAAAYERALPTQGYREQTRVDEQGEERPAIGYTTTFFPNTVKLSEAVGVRLEYGRETGGIDIFLQPVRKVKIRGQVISGISGQKLTNASIFLERMDAHNNGAMPAPAVARFDPYTSNFEIRDVTPGAYLMIADGADAGMPLSGRVPLTVPEQDIDTLSLLLTPQRHGAGRIRIEGEGRLDSKVALTAMLEPRSDHGARVSAGIKNGAFDFWVADGETYDVDVANLPDDFYVSGVKVNGTSAMDAGLLGSAVSYENPFELMIDSQGGKVVGRVVGSDGTAWSGASLMLIPDPAQGRLQAYREGYANEYGQFQIRGVAQGKYVLVAWLDEAPCDVYDAENLAACRAAGMNVTMARGGQEIVTFTAKPK
jgi:Carboxypeptidase regulatory-like domain